jgi:type I restriction enzyme S subunit
MNYIIVKKGKNIPKKDLTSEGVPCILYGEIYTKYNFTSKKLYSFIPHAIAQQSTSINKGDILFAGSGETAEEIGKCITYLGDEKACAGGDINILSPFNDDSTFLGYLLNSSQVNKQKSNLGQGSSVVHIYSSSLKTILISLPPFPEQQAIASALSDTDALITALEQLIAKKRNIKQGAMQQLLTGKKRLSGFWKEWEMKTLGEVLDTITDYTANGSFESLKTNVRYYETRNYAALVRTTDLGKVTFVPERFTDKHGYKYLKKTALFGGELIIANVGSLGKVFRVPYFNMPMTLAPNTYLLVCSKYIYKEYIYQWMRTNEFYQKLMGIIGSTTLQAINKDNLRNINILLPIEKQEQQAIAQILSDMDTEIEALEQKQAKYKAIKQGMMQELLTGKTRLV